MLSFRLIPQLGWGRGLFSSIFLAISAFCNAGFDNLGSTSLFAFQTDLLVNLVIAGLIITGGLGFMVWFDLAGHVGRKEKRTSALSYEACTIVDYRFVVIWNGNSLFLEWNNAGTIGNLPVADKVLVSFFKQ